MAPLSPTSLLSLLGTLAALEISLTTANESRDHHQQQLLLQQLQQQQHRQTPLSTTGDYVCQHPPYKVTMVSKSPLVIYIKDFISPEERAHLQLITKDSFTRSGVVSSSSSQRGNYLNRDPDDHDHRGYNSLHVRTSQSTSVPRDPVVQCIESRALSFQGYDVPASHLEPLQLVKYGPSEHYHYHTDWFPSSPPPPPSPETSAAPDPDPASPFLGGNRVSSFFVYIHVANDTTGGGTNFPRLEPPTNTRWCEEGIVDCDEAYEKGLTFLPVEGNAIYWENLDARGRGDERTLHAGLPVRQGGKIGMNIWTREGEVPLHIRGPDK